MLEAAVVVESKAEQLVARGAHCLHHSRVPVVLLELAHHGSCEAKILLRLVQGLASLLVEVLAEVLHRRVVQVDNQLFKLLVDGLRAALVVGLGRCGERVLEDGVLLGERVGAGFALRFNHII